MSKLLRYSIMLFLAGQKKFFIERERERESHGKLQIQHLHNSFTAGIFKVL